MSLTFLLMEYKVTVSPTWVLLKANHSYLNLFIYCKSEGHIVHFLTAVSYSILSMLISHVLPCLAYSATTFISLPCIKQCSVSFLLRLYVTPDWLDFTYLICDNWFLSYYWAYILIWYDDNDVTWQGSVSSTHVFGWRFVWQQLGLHTWLTQQP